MSDLSRQAQALIEAGRSEAPSAATKLHIKAKVLAEVGAASAATAASGASASGVSAAGAGGVFKAFATGALVLGLSAGALIYSQGSEPEPEPRPTTPVAPIATAPAAVEAVPVEVAPVEVAPVETALVEAAPVVIPKRVPRRTARAPAPKPRVAPVAPVDVAPAAPLDAMRLAQEARLLKQVRRALRDGDFDKVLGLAKTHQTEFPQGALRVERLAAQALAQCGLGAMDVGQRHRGELAELAPASVHLRRIDAACSDKDPGSSAQ